VLTNVGTCFDLVPFELKHPPIHDLLSHTILSETRTKRIGDQPRPLRLFRCRPEPQIKRSGHFPVDLPPEFAHANRPRHPGLRGSEPILLIPEAGRKVAQTVLALSSAVCSTLDCFKSLAGGGAATRFGTQVGVGRARACYFQVLKTSRRVLRAHRWRGWTESGRRALRAVHW
jgi:hypothetical protein